MSVGTVRGSPAARFLARRGLRVRGYADAEHALDALSCGEVRAVLYEAPILVYAVARRDDDRVRVLPGTYDNHGYGFGLRSGSLLREDVDRAMLAIVRDEEWQATLAAYLAGER